MPALPAQENTTNTYYADLGTKLSIDKLHTTEVEGPVSGIWNSILLKAFPPSQGYNVRPEQVTKGGIPDLNAVEYIQKGSQYNEYGFLVVQAKKWSSESKDSVWVDAMDGLLKYLPHLKPINRPHRVYGVVAVGRWARFVELDRQTGSLVKLNNTDKLHIARQCRTIERLLLYIRNNHS